MSVEYGPKISLDATGELIRILHDMGKGTEKFNSYIHYCSKVILSTKNAAKEFFNELNEDS